MPVDLALADLLRPYLLKGENTAWHAALSVIFVESFETALSAEGVVIRGLARFSGDAGAVFDPSSGVLSVSAANLEGHPRNQPDRREPWLDVTDAHLDFALSVPRLAGAIVASGVATIPGGDAAFGPVRTVLNALDGDPTDAGGSDYPGTGFTLDLVLSGIELRPPFLKPASMQPDGLLVPDTTKTDVVFKLPKVKVRVQQGSDAAATTDVSLVSLGVSGLDDPGALGAAEFVTMDPPYAFIGNDRTVGFGFRSAILDLADGFTPPAVIDQFGFDESWTGLYLPEIRLFVAPNGMQDFAVDVGVRNLLIGLGASSGITGDFEAMVVNQGAGELSLSARFAEASGRLVGITRTSATTATVQLAEAARMVVDVVGGRAPYAVKATYDGADHSGALHDVDLGSATEKTIVVEARDASTPPKVETLTIVASRRPAVSSLPPPGTPPAKPATVTTTSITLEGEPRTTPALVLVSQTDLEVVVGLATPSPTTAWKVDGVAQAAGPTVTVPLAGGETKAVEATLSGATVSTLVCYWRFDRPEEGYAVGYATNEDNGSSSMAVDPSASAVWTPPGRHFLDDAREVLKRATSTNVTIEGTASFEGDVAKSKYNYLLSRRRATALSQLLADHVGDPPATRLPGFSPTLLPADIGPAQPPAPWTADWQGHANPRNRWWKATLTGFGPVTLPGTVTVGQAHRPVGDPASPPVIPVPDTPPNDPSPPDWFRSAALKVRIVRDQFVAIELSGSIDFQTAAEQSLTAGGVSPSQLPDISGLGGNPSDGVVNFQILVQTDPASGTTEVKLYLGADPNDKDGLLMTGQLPGQPLQAPNTGRNVLGLFTILTPLLAATAPTNPADGNVGALALSGAVVGLPIALSEVEIDGQRLLNVERVVLYGGELDVLQKGDRWQTTLLFDVEAAISLRLSIGGFLLLEIPRDKPVSVRYKAIGLQLGFPPGSDDRFVLRPMFDSSKGYSIDVSGPGAIRVPDPLGGIFQVLGARVARTNPLNIELDLGFAVDLGVVTIDRARVRMPLDPVGLPELTAFGASLSVPGAIEGKGYLEIDSNPFQIKGQIDVSLVALKLRVAAGLAVAQAGGQTGVLVTLDLTLPVAIPLGTSGFGIYGFAGLFAMHYARDEDGISSLTPALTWLKDRANGDPTTISAWKPEPNHWAFGIGALLGTMEGGIIFNVKGMVMLELPGPRLLLVMKANLLAKLPDLKDKNAEGVFLCVIDLDFGRGTISIGLSIDFKITPIVQVTIPIEAYFNTNVGGDWHLYLGTFPGNDTLGRPMPGPIHAKILEVFDGSGYVMVSGHGIPAYKGLSAVGGVGLAVGLEVSIVWGNTSVGLYLRATAGFNAVLGFDPFYVGGLLYVRGELHLFIISISASADLTVQVGTRADGTKLSRIDGEVCGEVDFFFFSVEGCVDFHLGETDPIVPAAPDLVRAAVLVSRSPALVVGTGVDKGIDSKIGDADPDPAKAPVVPIDAIPMLSMSATPTDDGLKIFGEAPHGSPGAPGPEGFVKRGDYKFRYHVASVELAADDGSDPVMDGPTPSTWWTLNDPTGPNLVAQLSLLNWTPNPTPKAVERSKYLEETVRERWGTACEEAAPAAPVLWTFEREATGPSENGWDLDGVAWPDPAGTKRSALPNGLLHVREGWRSGDRDLDRRRGIVPAIVEGRKVVCHRRSSPPRSRVPVNFQYRLALETAALDRATLVSRGFRRTDVLETALLDPAEAIRRLASGTALSRASLLTSAFFASAGSAGAAAVAAPQADCDGRALAAPMFDIGLPVVFGDPKDRETVSKGLEERHLEHGPLDDVVVIDSGAVVEGNLLLLIRRELLGGLDSRGVYLRLVAADGTEIGRRPILSSEAVGVAGLPARWTDAAGPWFEPVDHVLQFASGIQGQSYLPCLVHLKGAEKAARIEIGLLHLEPEAAKKRETRCGFYLAAVELTSLAEVGRASWDDSETQRNQGVLETFLGPDSGDVALLFPNKLYRITATVGVKVRNKDDHETDGPTQTGTWWFRTDGQAPRSLEPWMLCTLPGEAEAHVFAKEPLRVVFATPDVDRLFAAYGKELRARLKAASFRQVEPPPGKKHPMPFDATAVQPVKGHVLSPFEGVVSDLLGEMAPCVAEDVDRTRHSMVTIDLPLDPYTDYLLDIEMVGKDAPANAVGERVLRRSFSTGAFGSLGDFAVGFQGASTETRFAPTGALQGIGTAFAARDPEGAELDKAMIDAGLEPMPVPKRPRVVVFWEQATPADRPQPAAVLVDASEPMRRLRPIPIEESSDDPEPTRRWRLTPTVWLDLVSAAGGDDVVDRVVWAPGRQRALVTLKAGARGKRLRMALDRKKFDAPYLDGPGAPSETFVVVDEALVRAPWEEA